MLPLSIIIIIMNAGLPFQLEVTMERFRDGDISGLTTAQSAMLGYQWSLAHRLKGNTHPTLTGWKDVTDMHTVNSTHVSRAFLAAVFFVSLFVCWRCLVKCLGLYARGANSPKIL